jgi:hypothetical protein
MCENYIIRIGDGNNFNNGSIYKTWGVSDKFSNSLKKMKPNDKLWFLQKGGKVIAVADFVSFNERVLGPLISLTPDDTVLKWNCKGKNYNIEIHYTNLYNLTNSNVVLPLKHRHSVQLYKKLKEQPLNLIVQYEYIAQLLNPTQNMFT